MPTKKPTSGSKSDQNKAKPAKASGLGGRALADDELKSITGGMSTGGGTTTPTDPCLSRT